MLGLGDPDIEHALSRTARQHRDDVAVLVGFNEPMARRIVAGSDFTLMPSRFEPCGLTQMQAQRYGALPVAHATGGLVDTIEEGVTGFLFSELSYDGLMNACTRAFDVFDEAGRLGAMRQAAMARRFTWAEPAAEYAALYGRLAGVAVLLDAARPVPAVAAHPGADAGRGKVRARSRAAAVAQALEVAAA
jgi:starch synthase